MFVLGIQGSPRKNGSTDRLLTSFLNTCETAGARTRVIRPGELDIRPCREITACETHGRCPIPDEMETMGYAVLRQADVIVLASPVFFYGITAQAKTFIDRCQMFWSRKYKLRLNDPARFSRQGFLLSVGASGGKRLFDGAELTARYFFDAVSADYAGALTFRKTETPEDLPAQSVLDQKIQEAVDNLLLPFKGGTDILFVSEGGGKSIMAAAFAMELSRGKIRAEAAGIKGGGTAGPGVIRAMADCGLDVRYMRFVSMEERMTQGVPERVIFLGTRGGRKYLEDLPPAAQRWDFPEAEDPAAVRDAVSERVRDL